MNAERVLVDANIAFKALVAGRGDLRNPLNPSGPFRYFAPRFLFVELFKHTERLMRAARLEEEEVLEALYTLVSRIEFIQEADIPLGTWVEAHRLCKDVDEKDTPNVALTLHLDGRLWTEDDELKTGLQARGMTSFFGS